MGTTAHDVGIADPCETWPPKTDPAGPAGADARGGECALPSTCEDARPALGAAGVEETLAPPSPEETRPDGSAAGVAETLAPPSQAAEPPEGDRASDYEFLGELGRGGMGVVFKARHRRLNRLVALKMIRDADAESDQRVRFQIEAEAVARLHHPNVVQIYDFGVLNGHPFVTLELLEGGSLAERMGGTPQDGRPAAALMAVLARAMEAAHGEGIVHRDLKPSNVLFDRNDTPKIADFGLAKRLEVEEGQTETGAVMGTPSYMAPEQAKGEVREIGPAADIYALGAILYEMLVGRPPFKGPSSIETMRQVVYDDPVPPSRLQPKVARDLETIALKCLTKEPHRRYSSAGALADDLERHLGGRPILARRTPASERVVKWARRRPAAATVLVLALAGAVVGAGAAWRRETGRRDHDSKVRAEVDRSLSDVLRSLGRKEWQPAQVILARVSQQLKGEPRLADLRTRRDQLVGEVNRGIADQAARAGDRSRYDRFRSLRDKALFHATQFTGPDRSGSQEAVRRSALEALALFAVSDAGDSWAPSPLPATLSGPERGEIAEGRYEFLLILADSTSRPDRELQLLDQTPRFHAPTHAYHLRRAACLAALRDGDGAARERREAERLPPVSAFDHFLTGLEHYRRRDFDAARRDFDTSVQIQPDRFWANCLSAVCALKLQRPELARASLNTCLQQKGDFAWLYVYRGFAVSQLAVMERAAAEKAPAKKAAALTAVDAQFRDAEADYAKALDLLEHAPDPDLRYILLVNRGVLRSQRRRWDEAEADLRQAVAIDGRQYQAFAALAEVEKGRGRVDEAAAEFGRAIAVRPDLAPLYRGRADVYIDLADSTPAQRTQALRDLEHSIRLEAPRDPVLARDQARRARLLRREHREEEALDACEKALAIVPDYAEAHRLRAGALMELGRPDEAIGSCDAAMAKGAASAELYEIRALAREGRKDFAGAIEDVTQALALRPGFPRLLVRRGWLHLLSEAPRLALRDFDEVVRLDPSDGDAYAGRGTARARLSDYRAAVADAEQALRLGDPSARRFYMAARIYVQAASAASAEVGRRGRDAVFLVAKFRDRATALAREAYERTPPAGRDAFLRDVLQDDPALRPIRRRLKFASLPAAAGSVR